MREARVLFWDLMRAMRALDAWPAALASLAPDLRRELLQDFPGVTRAQRQAIYAGYRRGQEGGRPLTKREYELLQKATKRVDPDDDPTCRLKQAMGYPTAAFPFSRVA